MKKILVILLVVVLAGSLAACGGSKATSLSGEAKDAVLAYSEAGTDNLMAGMNANDYTAFSKDFSQSMKAAMSEAEFAKLKKDRDTKLGLYVSRQVKDIVQTGNYYAVIYDTVFEKDDAVTMRVVFQAEEPHEISGLWFNK